MVVPPVPSMGAMLEACHKLIANDGRGSSLALRELEHATGGTRATTISWCRTFLLIHASRSGTERSK